MTLDVELVQALRTDYTQANLNEQDRAMLDYVAQLTQDATRLTPADIDGLTTYPGPSSDAGGFSPVGATVYQLFPTSLTWGLVLVAMAGAIVATLVAAALPARRAARLDPVKVMR